jgi:lauroyl/myristoyl acyltransferase
MRISLQSIINGRFGVGLGFTLGRLVPPKMGYRIAGFAARQIASRRDLEMVRVVRANQWIASGKTLSAAELDQAVEDTFRHTARSIYSFYHVLNKPGSVQHLVKMSSEIDNFIGQSLESKDGLIFAGIHISNFDMAFYAAVQHVRAKYQMEGIAFGYPNPGGGYQWQNEIRRATGLEVVPGSMAALRQASKLLRRGGVVVTGIDRPLADSTYKPLFFGVPAAMPVHHILLALMTKTPIVVTGVLMDGNGVYQIFMSDPIMMQPCAERREEILMNTEMVLKVAEGYIRQAPYQWAMFYPVWPEALNEMP